MVDMLVLQLEEMEPQIQAEEQALDGMDQVDRVAQVL
jgi:hypothetical protein